MNLTFTESRCACCSRPKPGPGETDAEMGFMSGLAAGFMFLKTEVLPLCPRHARMAHEALQAVQRFKGPT